MNIKTTDLEIQIADVAFPYKKDQHPEQKLNHDTLEVARRIARLIETQERGLNNFLLKESSGMDTEFRLVVRPDGTFYCHVLGRDSETFDGKLLTQTEKNWNYYSQRWIESK